MHAQINVHDSAAYEEYRQQVPAMIAAHGGRYLVRGGAVTPLEGNPQAARQVNLEFETMAALRAFYDSPEYAPLKALRMRAATGSIVAMEGL